MSKTNKPLNVSKSRTYQVRYNSVPILEGQTSLEEAVKFAYGLHMATLSTSHCIHIQLDQWKELHAMDLALFATADYFDHLIEEKDASK